jgi:surface antigen
MAIQYLSKTSITCLSTDTKPSDLEANSIALETDTTRSYIWTGSSWALLSNVTARKHYQVRQLM